MLPSSFARLHKDCLLVALPVSVLLFLLSLHWTAGPPCPLAPRDQQALADVSKPILLLWLWPEGRKFDLSDCRHEYDIDECVLTDQRSLYGHAEGVLIYHKAIRADLANLPRGERPAFQKWIWFNRDPPSRTQNLSNLNNLFNLTMSYRKDADISLRVRVLSQKRPQAFVVPPKDKLVCWVSDEADLGVARDYYAELQKHIRIEVFGKAFGKPLQPKEHYPTISSCKFHLSFETSIHPDYITHTLLDPLASGTVPVVLGPPRKNYEDLVPRDSFIHVNDFSDAKALAEALSHLDTDTGAYESLFAWRKHLYAPPRPLDSNKQFLHDVCLACQHLGRKRVYRRIHDVYKWFYEEPLWLRR